MTKPFDSDDDPAQVAAAKATAQQAAAQQDPLGEHDLIRAEAALIPGDPPVPRDAATLILYRNTPDGPRILMGCRSEGHDFMPNKYVFPGGRVDDEDALVPSLTELAAEQHERLSIGAQRATRAFPLTAIREMFEETGVIVGRTASGLGYVPAAWTDYYAQGAAPCLANFHFLGRAITPPMRHKRFDARFFIADADDALIDDRPPIDGRELADLRWFTLAEAAQLDLPNVTRFVISEVEARLVKQESAKPFYLYWAAEGHVRERIG
ncbi:MAG: NUDIX hydrolase [Hyphomonadaceae bacterium]|nr:NUDIX hydrolase [Hyphomonadaceae bacterium]